MNNIHVSFDYLFSKIRSHNLSKKYFEFNWLAVSKGGIYIAYVLSLLYDKPMGIIDPHFDKLLSLEEYPNVLLIDDIIHTGSTQEHCKALLNAYGFYNVDILTLIYDPARNKSIVPNEFILETTELMYFPWESKEEVEKADYI